MIKIKKRDGRIVDFKMDKVYNAIMKATYKCRGIDFEVADNIAKPLTDWVIQKVKLSKKGKMGVEEVQDLVEQGLIQFNYTDIAKEYILYRAERNRLREMDNSLMKTYEEFTFSDAQDSDAKRENANIDGDTAMGTMLKYGSEGAKKFNHLYLLDKDVSKAHKEGDIHIHDLDFYALTMTCAQIPLDKLFEGGFGTGHGFLREPNDIRSASALTCIAIQADQNDQHGGQSVPCLDYYLAPYIAKTFVKEFLDVVEARFDKDFRDLGSILMGYQKEHKLVLNEKGKEFFYGELVKLEEIPKFIFEKIWSRAIKKTDKETYQAMEAMVHNLNTMHSRAGAQVPFSSVNYGTDTTEEGRMVIRNILLAIDAGLGDGETAIFPISVFKVKEGVNYNQVDPNYDLFKLSMKVSAKRLFPNYIFLDASFNKQYYIPGRPETEVSTMGCRTRVMGNAFDKDNEISPGRGNLSFTSINLPRLALLAGKGNIAKFFELLDKQLELVVRQLDKRFRLQASKKVKNFPFLMGQGVWLDSEKLGPEDTVGEIIKHGSLSVGFIGLAETLTALIGKHHGESEEAQELGLKIIGYMRAFTDKKAEETGLNYGIVATPAEGLSGRFVNIDRVQFGTVEGVTDREYYTNSNHVPVYYNISAYDKIKIEAPYHELTNAGHIAYIELDGDISNNIEAFESVVRCMKESGIGYGAINHPVDRDPVCGYTGVILDKCPRCGRTEENGIKFERIRRITGYLVGTRDRFNNAKQAEERDRVKHGIKSA